MKNYNKKEVLYKGRGRNREEEDEDEEEEDEDEEEEEDKEDKNEEYIEPTPKKKLKLNTSQMTIHTPKPNYEPVVSINQNVQRENAIHEPEIIIREQETEDDEEDNECIVTIQDEIDSD